MLQELRKQYEASKTEKRISKDIPLKATTAFLDLYNKTFDNDVSYHGKLNLWLTNFVSETTHKTACSYKDGLNFKSYQKKGKNLRGC